MFSATTAVFERFVGRRSPLPFSFREPTTMRSGVSECHTTASQSVAKNIGRPPRFTTRNASERARLTSGMYSATCVHTTASNWASCVRVPDPVLQTKLPSLFRFQRDNTKSARGKANRFRRRLDQELSSELSAEQRHFQNRYRITIFASSF